MSLLLNDTMGPLAERVNDYLSTKNPVRKAFAAKEIAAEADIDEYLLERAEAQLRAAQAEVEEIRARLMEKTFFLELLAEDPT